MPSLLVRKKAGYGVGSKGERSATEEGCEFGFGIIRLGALAEGVWKGVLLIDEVAAERELSLLRERLEDEGEAGTARGAGEGNDMAEALCSDSVLRPVLPLALRRRARSLCSLNKFLGESEERGGTTKFEEGMVTAAVAIRARAVGPASTGGVHERDAEDSGN